MRKGNKLKAVELFPGAGVPMPVLRRTPPMNSLLATDSLSQTVSSRHMSLSCPRLSSLYTNVWS